MTKMLPGLLAAVLLSGAAGQEESAADLAREVQAILKESCLSCHGPKQAKGRFRLDSRTLALKGGLSSRNIVPGSRSKGSHLVELLLANDADERMPQEAPRRSPPRRSTSSGDGSTRARPGRTVQRTPPRRRKPAWAAARSYDHRVYFGPP